MIKQRQSVKTQTKQTITVSMIDEDLKNGINKEGMMEKYGIKKWEVDEMFKNPKLTGRRPSRKKELSFTFVDDTEPEFSKREESLPLNSGDIAVEQAEEVDPNQITLHQAIDEAIESVEDVKDQMQETQEAIEEMLNLPTIEDTMELVKEQQMEEGENSEDYGDDDGDDDFISDEPETDKEVEVEEDEFDSFEL